MQGNLLSQEDVIIQSHWEEPPSALVWQPTRLRLVARKPERLGTEGLLLSDQTVFLRTEPPSRIDTDAVQSLIQGAIPRWVVHVLDSVKMLLQLPEDWDSYHAQPVSPKSVESLVTLIAQSLPNMHFDVATPSVLPTVRGGIQLEWHQQGIDLEIEIPPSGKAVVSFVNAGTGLELEQEISLWDNIIPCLLEPLASDNDERNER